MTAEAQNEPKRILLDTLPGIPSLRVLVVGDVMLDIYDFCRFSESKPIDSEQPGRRAYFAHESVRRLGGAGNVAANLAALGAASTLVGIAGDDGHLHTLTRLANEAGITHRFIPAPDRPTTTKTRIYIDGDYLLRKDHEKAAPLGPFEANALISTFIETLAAPSPFHAVILSDYAKGCFCPATTGPILAACRAAAVPVIVDFKPANCQLFTGAGLLVPNESEADALLPGFRGQPDLPSALNSLMAALNAPEIAVTLGARGIAGLDQDGHFFHHPGHRVRAVDAVGCGDTVRAVLALGRAAGLPLSLAANLANHAAAVIVQKPATAALSLAELHAFLAKA